MPSYDLREFCVKITDSESAVPKTRLKVRGADGVVREFRGLIAWIESLQRGDDEAELRNSSAWFLRFRGDVTRWLEDAQAFLDNPPADVTDKLPSAVCVFFTTPAANTVLHPANAYEIAERLFAWYRQHVNSGIAEATRLREEFQNRKLQAVLAEAEKQQADRAAKSALENTQ